MAFQRPIADGGALREGIGVDVFPRRPASQHGLRWRDDADTHQVVMQGDVPEPATLVSCLQHHRPAFVSAGIAIGTAPVGPDRAFVQDGIPHTQAEAILQQSDLTAGIDDDFGANLTWRGVGCLHGDADSAFTVEEYVEHARALVDLGTMLAGVIEHHPVELAADDLPGLRAFVRLVVPEVDRCRQSAGGVDGLHAVLPDEVTACIFASMFSRFSTQ